MNAIEVDDVGDHGIVPAMMSESSESNARPIVFPEPACYRSETKSRLNTEIARASISGNDQQHEREFN